MIFVVSMQSHNERLKFAYVLSVFLIACFLKTKSVKEWAVFMHKCRQWNPYTPLHRPPCTCKTRPTATTVSWTGFSHIELSQQIFIVGYISRLSVHLLVTVSHIKWDWFLHWLALCGFVFCLFAYIRYLVLNRLSF